jgi:hypothetical protein
MSDSDSDEFVIDLQVTMINKLLEASTILPMNHSLKLDLLS